MTKTLWRVCSRGMIAVAVGSAAIAVTVPDAGAAKAKAQAKVKPSPPVDVRVVHDGTNCSARLTWRTPSGFDATRDRDVVTASVRTTAGKKKVWSPVSVSATQPTVALTHGASFRFEIKTVRRAPSANTNDLSSATVRVESVADCRPSPVSGATVSLPNGLCSTIGAAFVSGQPVRADRWIVDALDTKGVVIDSQVMSASAVAPPPTLSLPASGTYRVRVTSQRLLWVSGAYTWISGPSTTSAARFVDCNDPEARVVNTGPSEVTVIDRASRKVSLTNGVFGVRYEVVRVDDGTVVKTVDQTTFASREMARQTISGLVRGTTYVVRVSSLYGSVVTVAMPYGTTAPFTTPR